MAPEKTAGTDEPCTYHNGQLSFIYSLKESGLINVMFNKGELFIPLNQLKLLEKMNMFKQDMEINNEGIETINYLLTRISDLRRHLFKLNSELAFYRSDVKLIARDVFTPAGEEIFSTRDI